MNAALVEKVVNAVLYEGYILYPYRASSKKNRERFTFGRVYPEDYSIAQRGAEPCMMQTECLLRNESKDALVTIGVRFLHPMAREVGVLATPIDEMPADGAPDFERRAGSARGRAALPDLAGGGGAEGGSAHFSLARSLADDTRFRVPVHPRNRADSGRGRENQRDTGASTGLCTRCDRSGRATDRRRRF